MLLRGHHAAPLQECPCNSRYGGDPEFYPTSNTKVLARSFTAIPAGACKEGQSFPTAEKCFDAVAQLGFNATKIANKSSSVPAAPHGCVFVKNADGSAEALFNTGGDASPTAAGCASVDAKVAASSSPVTKVSVAVELKGTKTGVATITLSGPAGGWSLSPTLLILSEAACLYCHVSVDT